MINDFVNKFKHLPDDRIYNDYQDVYKAMSGDKFALANIEKNYGKINNMGDLYKIGSKLYELLNNAEKLQDYTQNELALGFMDSTKKQIKGN